MDNNFGERTTESLGTNSKQEFKSASKPKKFLTRGSGTAGGKQGHNIPK